ncbi:hypothetical protein C0J52_06744, partial [Blattella germanica]
NSYIFECLVKAKSKLGIYVSSQVIHTYITRHNYMLHEPSVRLTKSKKLVTW